MNLTREGCAFSGWKPKPDRMPANDTTVVAQWTANNYTVTFNPAGGNVSVTTMSVVYDQEYGTLPVATRTGHTFLGWFTGEEDSAHKVTEKTVCNTAFDHTLYAHWAANNYTVTFDYGNGTNTSTELKYNETIIYPEGATRDGYRLVGWFTDSACTVPFTGKTATEDIILYAKFEKIQVSSSDSGSRIHSEGDNSEGDGSFSLLTAPLFVLVALLF